MPDRPHVPAGWDRVVRALRDAVPGSTATIVLTVPADARAALTLTSVAVARPDEPASPPYPRPCNACGTDYQVCTDAVLDNPLSPTAGACCGACRTLVTHDQDAWEARYSVHHSRSGDRSTVAPGMG